MPGGADAVVQVSGPWTHRSVTANGCRFHVAHVGEGPLVLLLHGFPEFWWTWRHSSSAGGGRRPGGRGRPARLRRQRQAAQGVRPDHRRRRRGRADPRARRGQRDRRRPRLGRARRVDARRLLPQGGTAARGRVSMAASAPDARRGACSPLRSPVAVGRATAAASAAGTRWPSRCRCSRNASWSGTAVRSWGRSFLLVGTWVAGRGHRSGLPAGHAHPAGCAHLARVPPVVRPHLPAGRPAVRPPDAVAGRRPRPAPARRARLRASRRRPPAVRAGTSRARTGGRSSTAPATSRTRSARALRRRAARLARRPRAGPVRRDRDPAAPATERATWWTWRHQLAVLPEAGFRAVAVDLRGYGASDKPPAATTS